MCFLPEPLYQWNIIYAYMVLSAFRLILPFHLLDMLH